jgi:hypothetical protein
MTLFDDNPVLPVLNALGKVSLKNFSDRIRLQKQTYLAQELGCDSGFSFMWYLHGPYSPSLTKFLYAADEVGALNNISISLASGQIDIVRRIKSLLREDINEPSKLELYSSVWYQLPNYAIPVDEFESIIDFLEESKPQFSRDELYEAANRIIEFSNDPEF